MDVMLAGFGVRYFKCHPLKEHMLEEPVVKCVCKVWQYLQYVQSPHSTFKTYISLFKESSRGQNTVNNQLPQSIFNPNISLCQECFHVYRVVCTCSWSRQTILVSIEISSNYHMMNRLIGTIDGHQMESLGKSLRNQIQGFLRLIPGPFLTCQALAFVIHVMG